MTGTLTSSASSSACSAAVLFVKKASWAALKRFHSLSSSVLLPRGATFHSAIRSRSLRGVPDQSVDVARASAAAISSRLRDCEALRVASSSLKCVRRALSNAVRAALNRCQSSCSVVRSARGRPFHSSTIAVKRSVVAFHAVEDERRSASSARARRDTSACSRCSALRAAAWTRPASMAVCSRSHRASSEAMSPTNERAARASRTLVRTVAACSA